MKMGLRSDSELHLCPPNMVEFVHNMTAPYCDQGDQTSVVAISALTFILAAAFFDLNLFSRISRVSAVLNPTVRLFLAGSLNLFLPVMSYLFSEAKKQGTAGGGCKPADEELSLLARVILTWMLLVELLRKKLEGALVIGSGTQGYSSIISQASRVLWMGNLVFFTVKASGKKAMFGVLWALCAAKLVQRVVITEMAKRSFAHGKNPRLISSYMAMDMPAAQRQLPSPTPSTTSSRLELEQCRYAVMGEENMVIKAGPRGYELNLALAATDHVLTVGKIWRTQQHPKLKRLCLSFALFKLLRRRLENMPAMTKRETRECRSVIFDGLCNSNNGGADLPAEVTLFQVLKDEMTFLTEYYHSVLPVVLASPYFFFVNYVFFPVVVVALCVTTIVLCGNGGILYAFKSIRTDSSVISIGVATMTKCLWNNVIRSSKAFYTFIDVTICYLLFIAVAYEEASEIFVFLVSNWFTVLLLHAYSAKPRSPAAVRFILLLSRNLRRYPSLITIKQLSVLGMYSLSALTLPSAKLPKRAKHSILERFRGAGVAQDGGGAAPLRKNGLAALSTGKHRGRFSGLAWACESGGAAEVILVWHIATSLLETKHSPHPTEQTAAAEERRSRKTAARLSRYCAYLVAFRPELLPDNREGTELVYSDMKEQIKAAVGWWSYHFSSEWSRRDKVRKIGDKILPDYCPRYANLTMLEKGAVLGKVLVDEADKDGTAVWGMLADVWVELVVYVAPSSVEEHAKGHEAALVQGIELVTMLWVLATHTGIIRPDDDHHDEEQAPAPAPASV